MDPHIFADPDPGSQNLADPTDTDPAPKHWMWIRILDPPLKKMDLKLLFSLFANIFLALTFFLQFFNFSSIFKIHPIYPSCFEIFLKLFLHLRKITFFSRLR